MKSWEAKHLDDLGHIAQELLEAIEPRSNLYFYGDLGAGKTTFIKRILVELGYQGDASSPSYSLVNVYALPNGKELNHIDLYRLKDGDEALGIGIDNYLYPEFYTFIEWPQIIEDITPEHTYTVQVEAHSDQVRTIKLDRFYQE